MSYHIRWMIRRDMPEVLEIENASFEFPWTEKDFIRCLRERNVIGMVVECDERVVGFMIYELRRNVLEVLNFAVLPSHRGQRVGTKMVEKLAGKLARQRRNTIRFAIRETNLAGQLFCKAMGFRAITVLHDQFEDTTDDAYLMVFRYGQAVGVVQESPVEVDG